MLNAAFPHRRLAALLGALVSSVSFGTSAAPKWHVAWQPSWCLTGQDGAFVEESSFCNHVLGDVVFGRERDRDFGLGPYVALGSADFDDLRLQGGVTALLPLDPTYPFTVSLGFVAQKEDATWDPGLGASLLWGPRSYNFHGSYSAAGGLVLGAHYGFGERHATTLYVGLALDGMWLALPFLAAYQWLRGAPD